MAEQGELGCRDVCQDEIGNLVRKAHKRLIGTQKPSAENGGYDRLCSHNHRDQRYDQAIQLHLVPAGCCVFDHCVWQVGAVACDDGNLDAALGVLGHLQCTIATTPLAPIAVRTLARSMQVGAHKDGKHLRQRNLRRPQAVHECQWTFAARHASDSCHPHACRVCMTTHSNFN